MQNSEIILNLLGTSNLQTTSDLLEIRKSVKSLPDIKKIFFVKDVEFEIKKSYLSLSKSEYTKHEVKNKSNGKTAILTHEKIKEYLL